ncbi:MAG TPA: hypothetical protein ENK57_12360 [Polyangiaceae bacterium]|nr:hypothetical protein [Polyangiaceae bacterium]
MDLPAYHVSDDRAPMCPNDWLVCLQCRRLFQVKHLHPDGIAYEACPFCSVGGLGVVVHRWPFTTRGLRFGMECP